MRKNGLGRLEANAVARARGWLGRWFRPVRVVPDEAFQGETEPFPDHWRTFPQPWTGPVSAKTLRDALATLPETWREVLLRHDGPFDPHADDELTTTQERDVLTRARAGLRDALDAAQRRPAP